MTLKHIRKNSGFTIIELLIVIVVIAILAAVGIVGYNSIQQRTHTPTQTAQKKRADITTQKVAAANLAKKLEAYYVIKSTYPTYDTQENITKSLDTIPDTSLKGSGITIGIPTATTDDYVMELSVCTGVSPKKGVAVPTGYIVSIWDNTLSKPGLNPIKSGGTATITNSTPNKAICTKGMLSVVPVS